MTPCTGCGLHSCAGECFTQCPADFDGDPEMEAWLAKCAREEAALAADANEQLAPHETRRKAA